MNKKAVLTFIHSFLLICFANTVLSAQQNRWNLLPLTNDKFHTQFYSKYLHLVIENYFSVGNAMSISALIYFLAAVDLSHGSARIYTETKKLILLK